MTKFAVRFNKTGVLVDADISESMVIRAALHGLQQKCNDSYVDNKKFPTDADKFKEFNRVLASVVAGEWSSRIASNLSPLDQIIYRIAADRVKAAIKAKGYKLSTLKEGVFDKNVEAYKDKKLEELTKLAEKELAAKAKSDTTEVELDLGTEAEQ